MSQCRKRSLVPRGRELMLWLDKTMRAWRCAAGKEPGWDVGASEETAVAALPQVLQPSSVVAAARGDVAPLALPRLPSFCWHSHPCCGVRALPGWKPRSHLLWLGRVSVPWAPGVTAGAPAWAQRRRWRRTVSDGWESKTDLTLLSFADFGAGDSRAACSEGLLVHWADWGSSTNQIPVKSTRTSACPQASCFNRSPQVDLSWAGFLCGFCLFSANILDVSVQAEVITLAKQFSPVSAPPV